MKVTVKELIEKLHEYPPDADVVIEDLDDDQEFFIVQALIEQINWGQNAEPVHHS